MNEMFHTFLQEYHAGTSTSAYSYLGCHRQSRDGEDGFVFRVWAPNAKSVSVVGEFNYWNGTDLPMMKFARGIWEGWSKYAKEGDAYKYLVEHYDGTSIYKADPVGFRTCRAPDTSSVICDLSGFHWHDKGYFARQEQHSALNSPMNVYELHLGSWRRKKDGSLFSYAEIAPQIADYAKNMGYTHVELMPLAEYPYGPSLGYQVTGFYAPTSRYGSPKEFMTLVDTLHRAGVGVILDWVPAFFPKDIYGLYEFDGTCTYELADPDMNEHPEWGTRIFDYGRPEVKSFLISNAIFWLKEYHIDGIRVDAVSSMLYLDYGRPNYKPNRHGGRENLEAIAFLQQLNKACFALRPSVIMAAEESTAYPLVTKPDYVGGLGFLFKWNTGWTDNTLSYLQKDPLERKYIHEKLTFPMTYAFSENYVLPLSHDEVVDGKCSLISKMPGACDWKFANLRLLLGYQMAHPGKKLLFMGGEFGQFTEWSSDQSLDWTLLGDDRNRQMQAYARDLNHFYLRSAPLWSDDSSGDGFSWIQPNDRDYSVLAFRRIDRQGRELICILNFTPVVREDYCLGLPEQGTYRCVFSSDEEKYGGSGTRLPAVTAQECPFGEYAWSGDFRLAPMSAAFYAREHQDPKES